MMRQEIKNEYGETLIRIDHEDLGEITEEEMAMLRKAKGMPFIYDNDCPPMSEKLKERMMRRIEENERVHQSA